MCGYVFLWKATQEGQIFGSWQSVLRQLNIKGHFKTAMLLGGCEICFAHFISWVAYAINISLLWDDWPMHGLWVNIIYALFFIAINWRICITQLKHLD